MAQHLLSVEDLRTEFQRATDKVYAVNGLSFTLAPGETLGIVGESGSGKSVSVMTILGLVKGASRVSGKAFFQGKDLLKLKRFQLEDIRGRDIGVVFQDPMTSLNPRMRIGDQIMEAMLTHGYASHKASYERTLQLLAQVGLPEPESRFRNYPHEFSGGMRQRVMIAMAVACEPQLLIADEPTTALDVSVQMQILTLLARLRDQQQMSVIMITHDFGVATNFCDRIIVMYSGMMMESAPLEDFLTRPAHPYTIGLKQSIIEFGDRGKRLHPIPGMAATLKEPPSHCPFADRCSWVVDRCRTELPEQWEISPNHRVACHRAEEVMAHVD